MSMSFFVGEITNNKPSEVFPERRELNSVLDLGAAEPTTIADLIYDVIANGERSLTPNRIWFHSKEHLWVQIIVTQNSITLELGEPAA